MSAASDPDAPGPALRARDLGADAGPARLLDGVDLDLAAGRVLAVVGPSGSGKSTLGLALLGEGAAGVVPRGSVRVGGAELLAGDAAARRRHRAGRVGRLPQHPAAVLDPVRRVGSVLDELAGTVHRDPEARRAAVRDALARARVPRDEGLERRYPHQLSGGQQQRMALAQTLVTAPEVVVLDEPTSGLDPATASGVVAELAALAAGGVAVVLLTHDLPVARALAHEAVALRDGRVERRGTPAAVLGPASTPPAGPAAPSAAGAAGLDVREVTVRAPGGPTLLAAVSLSAGRGEGVGVVGPSGAGKSTLGRVVAGLDAPASGRVALDGVALAGHIRDRPLDRRRRVQYVPQDPRASFLPRRPVLDQVARPGRLLRGLDPAAAVAEAGELLGRLGLPEAAVRRRPHSLSGGQLQRAALARCLLARPDVLVADEAFSALDAAHRDVVHDALAAARAAGTAVLLVSHDTDGVAAATTRTVVLERGAVVDEGPTPAVLARRIPVTGTVAVPAP